MKGFNFLIIIFIFHRSHAYNIYMSNIKLLVCGDVKAPQRKFGDAGIDLFVPNYSEQFIKDLQEYNPNMTIEGFGDINIHYDIVNKKYVIQVKSSCDIRIPSYIRALIPPDMCLRMTNKSGVATKQKLIVGAELIDSSYEGICIIHLFNISNKLTTIDFGQKLSQIVPIKIDPNNIDIVYKKDISIEEFYKDHNHDRGEGAFGSTSLFK